MRNREVIEREIYHAREDLEASLAELKHVVQEKVDVKARARVAIQKGKQRAQEVLDRGVEVSRDVATRGKHGARDLYTRARQRPDIIALVVGSVLATTTFIYIGRQRRWW